MKKVDIFTHILTPKYIAKFAEYNPKITSRVEYHSKPGSNVDVRERMMSRTPGILQVITMGNIPLEKWAPDHSAELAHIGNEELAELVSDRPDLFYAAAAILPMNDVDASLKEIDHAIGKLRLAGIQVQTRIGAEWLASEKFRPILAKMAELNKPIWIHPDDNDQLDDDFGRLNWPFETSHCMMRLVDACVFNDFPDLKFIVHHAGAMIPTFRNRLARVSRSPGGAVPVVLEPFKKFYVDTALYGNTAGLMNAYDFYGPDHLLFGTDSPYGPPMGIVDETIQSVKRMPIPEEDKLKIFRHNAVNILKGGY